MSHCGKNFCLTAKRTEAPDDLKRKRQGNKANVDLEGWWRGMGASARGGKCMRKREGAEVIVSERDGGSAAVPRVFSR